MPIQQPAQKYVSISLDDILDESSIPNKVGGLTIAQNVVYRRFGSVGKRTGSGPYGGNGAVGSGQAVASGVRWYRGRPSITKQMIVQSNDTLYQGNDVTGAFTSIGTLTAGSSPAFYASCYDPAESGVVGTPASDILIVAYGSGSPKKWDGTNLTALSPSITASYTGCSFWHEHVWFWGDPSNPDTLSATDLGNPESFAFVNTFGGYQVGRGDGDSLVQRCLPLGSQQLVFKNRSIYNLTGFDFQAGDYQFALSPLVEGIGTSSPFSVARLRNSVVFWSGQNFYRLAPGSSEPEPLGTPIVKKIAAVAQYSQTIIRAVAGDFLVQGVNGYIVYNNVYLCAVDIAGTGVADTILMYDEDASARKGRPAWTVWTGLKIGCWIPWGGPGDQKLLYYGDAVASQVNQIGQNATKDTATTIPVLIQTGRSDSGTPDLLKELDRAFIDVEATTATFSLQVTSEQSTSATTNQPTTTAAVGGKFGTAVFGTDIFGPSSGTAYQSVEAFVQPSLRGLNFTFLLTESSTTAQYELVNLGYHVIEESLRA